MLCPKCGTEMQRVDLSQLVGTKVFSTLECPSCHCRAQQQQGKGRMPSGRFFK